MPSSRKAKRAILECVSGLKGNIYELGSGWGGLALALAKKFPERTIWAYEISIFPWFFACVLKFLFQTGNVHFVKKNFFHISLERADVVVCYLYPKAMMMLNIKFNKELKDSAYVISNSFTIPYMKPLMEKNVDDLWNSKIYVYNSKSVL